MQAAGEAEGLGHSEPSAQADEDSDGEGPAAPNAADAPYTPDAARKYVPRALCMPEHCCRVCLAAQHMQQTVFCHCYATDMIGAALQSLLPTMYVHLLAGSTQGAS